MEKKNRPVQILNIGSGKRDSSVELLYVQYNNKNKAWPVDDELPFLLFLSISA
jgi:hypothetical protein